MYRGNLVLSPSKERLSFPFDCHGRFNSLKKKTWGGGGGGLSVAVAIIRKKRFSDWVIVKFM